MERGAAGEEASLLDSVLELLAEKGFAEMTMDAVLERTGLDKLTFHHYFGSVDEALQRGLEREAETFRTRVVAAGKKAESWAAGLRAALRAGFDLVDTKPVVTRIFFLEGPAADERVSEIHRQLSARLCRLLDSARAHLPADRQPPPLTARFALAAIEYATVHRPAGMSEEEHLDSIVYFVLLLYFGRDAAEAERRPAH
jgi:AcrR family transcriptional regulator